jgi:Tfp pilus assembly protein PilO
VKSTDRSILLGVGVVVLAIALWIGVISPKRSELSKLDGEIATLNESVSSAEAIAATAEQAEQAYKENYHRLVVLGKAVPSEADSASLLVQTTSLANQAGIEFRTLKLAAAGDAPVPETAAAQTTADPPPGEEDETAPAAPVAAPATEAAAAGLPIGATVGPAGLPVMPYDLTFTGDFFEIADFIDSLDSLVDTESSGPGVDGRLVTVDAFSLTADEAQGFPHLSAAMHVTTYVTPPDQGLTAGASPVAPAATTDAVVPVSTP